MTDLNPIATNKAYVDEAIKEKFAISIEIRKDPAAATENSEKSPKPSKFP